MNNKWINLFYGSICGLVFVLIFNLMVATGHTTAMLIQKYIWVLL
jgi:hypothetical protein